MTWAQKIEAVRVEANEAKKAGDLDRWMDLEAKAEKMFDGPQGWTGATDDRILNS